MNTDFIIGEKTYELRLTTRGTVKLEKALGQNPITLFVENGEGTVPQLSDILIILYYALQANHKDEVKNMDAVYDLYDEYVSHGGNLVSLISTVVDVLQESGLMPKVDEVKN